MLRKIRVHWKRDNAFLEEATRVTTALRRWFLRGVARSSAPPDDLFFTQEYLCFVQRYNVPIHYSNLATVRQSAEIFRYAITHKRDRSTIESDSMDVGERSCFSQLKEARRDRIPGAVNVPVVPRDVL